MHIIQVVLNSTIISALTLVAASLATVAPTVTWMTNEQFHNWLDHTDAKLTFIGKPISRDLSKRNVLDSIQVVYCTIRQGDLCGGLCTSYIGGPICLKTPYTACIAATGEVTFCDRGNCRGSCNKYSTCGTKLGNNYCYTPGTVSIQVG